MRDPKSVITTAAAKITDKLADDYEVSIGRMGEILSSDNPYPKSKRLIRAIARHNPDGAKLIKADLLAMFAQIFDEEISVPTDAELTKELCDVFHARLAGKPKDERLRQCREALAVLHREMKAIEEEA